MERNELEDVVAQTVPAKAAWAAPKVVETDIEAVTLAGSGPAIDGVTTSS